MANYKGYISYIYLIDHDFLVFTNALEWLVVGSDWEMLVVVGLGSSSLTTIMNY